MNDPTHPTVNLLTPKMKEYALSNEMAAVARTTGRNPYGDQRYNPPEQALQSTSRPLVKAVLRRLLLWWVIPGVISLLVIGFSQLASGDSYGYSSDPDPVLLAVNGALQLITLAGFIAALALPMREQLSEWQTLIPGRSDAAGSAFAAIFGVLRARQVPAHVTPRRFYTGTSQPDNALVVRGEGANVYITSFAYGTGLYLGWSMWRSRFPIPILWAAIRETASAGVGIERGVHRTIRTARLRALREAVASAAAEGVDAAIAGTEIPVAATFGYDVPITHANTAPVPVPTPPAPPIPALPSAYAPHSAPVPPVPTSPPAPPVPVPPVPTAPPMPPSGH